MIAKAKVRALTTALIAFGSLVGGAPAQTPVSGLDLTAYAGGYTSGDVNSGTAAFFDPHHPDWSGNIGVSFSWGGNGTITTLPNASSFFAGGEYADLVNISGTDSYINPAASGGNSTYSFDFSGLSNGYLPAGTFLTFFGLDVAGEEALLTSDQSSSWLEVAGSGDYIAPVTAITVPGFSFSSGSYTVSSALDETEENFLLLRTTQDLTSLGVAASHSTPAAAGWNFNMLAPVPEPSSALLGAMAGGIFLLRRRR